MRLLTRLLIRFGTRLHRLARMDSKLITADGLALHRRAWPLTAARGTVLIVHGLGEHIGRYAHVAAQLNRWGWRVVGHDHRGHGASAGPHGSLTEADDLLRDLALAVDAVRAAHPSEPLLLLGHSMGGAVAARFVAEGVVVDSGSGSGSGSGVGEGADAVGRVAAPWFRPVDGLVLSSPALAADLRWPQRLQLAVAGRLAPNLRVANGLEPAALSRDAAVVRAYLADPLNHDRITPRLARFILDAGAQVRDRATAWTLPTLLLYGGCDRIVAPAGSAAFAAAAPSAVVTVRRFEALFHEIFNEPEQGEVFAALGDWLARFG